MAPGFQGASSSFLLRLLNDDLQGSVRGVEQWNIPKARGEFLVTSLWEKTKELQVIAKERENFVSDFEEAKAEFDKSGTAYRKIKSRIRILKFRVWIRPWFGTLEKLEAIGEAIMLEVVDKQAEIEDFERRFGDLEMRSESLKIQMAERDLMTLWTKRGAFLKSGSLATTFLSTSSLLVARQQQQEQRLLALKRQARTGATVSFPQEF